MSFDVTNPIGDCLAGPALAALGRHTEAPDAVRQLLAASAARLTDSAMVVEEDFHPFRDVGESRVKTPLPQPDVLHAIRALIDEVRETGFGPHSARFFGLLGSVMIDLSGTETQKARVQEWVDAGLTACFAMTDRGGPLATQWLSEISTDTPPRLTVDKVWSMNANRSDFGIIIVRQGKSMVMAPVLVPPGVYATAETCLSGPAFFDGHLPLGDVKMAVDQADPDWVLRSGGPISSKVFLSLARPFLIQALVAHVRWLEDRGRLRLDAVASAAVAYLSEAARNQSAKPHFDKHSEDQAMALKWIANETWLHLVVNGLVPGQNDARDLISLSKMEGSSYRCFFEIYQRNKRFRDVAA
ncbi:hypothetical protein GGQ68_001022 [Sagittula marina]|uniref:Acyl-CoA dehydrogenase n=1 Tax=Sagittula marina TaxID=943940 RepID=A0A7W6GQU1_9RHOB|nr:hypothetical protein [Sagittula marina]MBB3984706.1 hypothetical protein [Sagittula marina]